MKKMGKISVRMIIYDNKNNKRKWILILLLIMLLNSKNIYCII